MQKILVLGVSGMLGSALYTLLAGSTDFAVLGTARSLVGLDCLPRQNHANIASPVDANDLDSLIRVFVSEKPSIIVNCVGIIKQAAAAKDPLTSIAVNSLLPHRLAHLSATSGARLIHISTDCVFSGRHGNYNEQCAPDADDLYGRTKLLGEVDCPNAVTLRTSMVGHELHSNLSLVDWFLSQSGNEVRGYQKAFFSGLPTIELARVIRDVVIPRPDLRGLWHVASDPINKFDLLRLVAKTYGKDIKILPDDSVRIDRSLDGSRFRAATGYSAAPWPELVQMMYAGRPRFMKQ